MKAVNRPYPTPADRAEAERILPMMFPDADPVWIENHRADLISYAADAIMLKRMNDEARRARTPQKEIAEAVGQYRRDAA